VLAALLLQERGRKTYLLLVMLVITPSSVPLRLQVAVLVVPMLLQMVVLAVLVVEALVAHHREQLAVQERPGKETLVGPQRQTKVMVLVAAALALLAALQVGLVQAHWPVLVGLDQPAL